MSTPYKDLEFSLGQNLILLRLKYFKMRRSKVYLNSRYTFLRKYSLVVSCAPYGEYVTLSDKGRMYLRYRRKDKFRYWIPVVISIVALFAGYDVYTIPLLEKILQAVASLLKTITESLGAFF